MAYTIGSPIDAASYVAFSKDKLTNTKASSLRMTLGGTNDVVSGFFDHYTYNDLKTYNLVARFDTYATGNSNYYFEIKNAVDVVVFKWYDDDSTPVINTHGWAYLYEPNYKTETFHSHTRINIKIPASDSLWKYQFVINDLGAFSAGNLNWGIDFYQAQTDLIAGWKVMKWDTEFTALGELTVSEDDVSGLKKTDHGRYGGEPVTGDGYIRFHGNGNTSGVMSDQTIANYAVANLTANAFVRTGYNFLGWNTDAAAIVATYSDEESYTMSYLHDKVLYAIWEVI